MTHPYKEILMAIANGEQVQWQTGSGRWMTQLPEATLNDVATREFTPDRYRVKPRTININGIEVPEPVREVLQMGARYWVPGGTVVCPNRWNDDSADHAFLANGWVHLTKEAAEMHFNALVSFTKRESA